MCDSGLHDVGPEPSPSSRNLIAASPQPRSASDAARRSASRWSSRTGTGEGRDGALTGARLHAGPHQALLERVAGNVATSEDLPCCRERLGIAQLCAEAAQDRPSELDFGCEPPHHDDAIGDRPPWTTAHPEEDGPGLAREER